MDNINPDFDIDSNLALLAVAKVLKKDDVSRARNAIKPGKHTVDCIVHIQGTMSVAQDGNRDIHATVDYKKVAALLCETLVKKTGIDETILEDVIRIVMEMAISGSGDDTILKLCSDIEKELTAVTDSVPCKGRVTTKLNVKPLIRSPFALSA